MDRFCTEQLQMSCGVGKALHKWRRVRISHQRYSFPVLLTHFAIGILGRAGIWTFPLIAVSTANSALRTRGSDDSLDHSFVSDGSIDVFDRYIVTLSPDADKLQHIDSVRELHLYELRS